MAAILILGALVFLHEYGHYICARMTGTPMTRFSIGFGRRLFACSFLRAPNDSCGMPSYVFSWVVTGKGGTQVVLARSPLKQKISSLLCLVMGTIVWEIRLLPFGGFVDPQMSRDKPRLFRDSLVILGGPVVNFLIAFSLLTLCHMVDHHLSFLDAAQLSASSILGMIQETFQFLLHPFGGSGEVSGPIGIITIGKTYVQQGWIGISLFAASLSCSLAIVNMLPIPPLDGGALLFVWIRTFSPKRGARIEAVVHGLGTIGIIALFIGITIHDITKLF